MLIWLDETLIAKLGSVFGGGEVTSAEFAIQKSDLAYLTLDNFMLLGRAVKQYDGQAQDLFVDETGVTTKTDMSYDAANNRYYPTTAGFYDLLIQSDATAGSTAITDTTTTHTADITNSGVTHENTVADAFGGATTSLTFDGSSKITIADSADWTLSSTATIKGWMNPTDIVGTETLLGQWTNVTGDLSWVIQKVGSEFQFIYSTTGLDQVTITTSGAGITAGAWQHWALVLNGSDLSIYLGTSRVYNNASFAGTIRESALPLVIGTNGAGTNYYSGYMEDLSVSTNTADYSGATKTVPTAPLTVTRPNITFVSDPFSALTVPTSADAYIMIQSVSGTPSTDLTVGVRREGASSYSESTITDTGRDFYDIDTAETYDIYKVDDLDLSIQTSGTAPQLRMTSANNPDFFFKGWLLQWV